jgi:hypothetical protein
MTPPAVADLACPLRWSQLGLAKQCTFTAAARRQRRGGRPRTAAATPPGRCRPRASRQSPPHHEQGISQLAALGKQLVECLPHAGAAAVLTVIMAREHPPGARSRSAQPTSWRTASAWWSPSTKISPKLASRRLAAASRCRTSLTGSPPGRPRRRRPCWPSSSPAIRESMSARRSPSPARPPVPSSRPSTRTPARSPGRPARQRNRPARRASRTVTEVEINGPSPSETSRHGICMPVRARVSERRAPPPGQDAPPRQTARPAS